MFKNVEEPLLNSDWMYTFSHLLVYNVVVVVGDEEMHLVTMQSKCEKVPCFWCCSVCTGDRPFNLLFYHSSQTSQTTWRGGARLRRSFRRLRKLRALQADLATFTSDLEDAEDFVVWSKEALS